jgi:glycosyltransferase involved in cell wall biosynthesis
MALLTVTVLITTFNYGQFVEQAIESVLAQDFPLEQVQILVVDDGSTDDTSERVKKYGSRIEYFYKANGGQASSLNFGFSKARGEIVALLDADDFFLPGKLERIVDAFQQDPALGMVYHRLQEWHVQTNERRDWDFSPVSGDIHTAPDEFRLYVPQPTSAISFRRTSLNRLLPIPEEIRMLADCYVVALIPFLSRIQAISESLAVYRIHGTNSYTTVEQQVPMEVRKNRLQMWQVLIDAMRRWLAGNHFTKRQPAVRLFLDRWALYQGNYEAQVEAPGRLRFFRHLMTYIRCYGANMSSRLRLVNYVNAFGALVVGYKHFGLLDKLRTQWVDRLGMRRK